MNTANALYGMIGSAALFWILIGLVLFLFQWPFSQAIMLNITAWGIGLSFTCGLKYLLTLSCRVAQYKSFYRIRPSGANISALALECWYIGLGASVLIGRITQFLFAAAFWIGRIDVGFLSEDVSLFGYSFDYVPTNFVKDLLVHEAHRHPHIQRLAQLYLLKLRHKSFASPAGAAWRQLVVVALFPWAMKYRVFDEARLQEALTALEDRHRMHENETRRYRLENVAGGAVTETAGEVLGGVGAATENAGEVLGGAVTGLATAVTAFTPTWEPQETSEDFVATGAYSSETETLKQGEAETSLLHMSAGENESDEGWGR
jgi:hypothetical protein